MPNRLLRLSVFALAGALMAVLAGHLWERHSQLADASGLEHYLGAYVVATPKDSTAKDQEAYQSVEGRARAAGAQEASAE